MHKADDPRNYVGDVIEATETDDGLAIKGRFDLDTEFGKSRTETSRAAECQVRPRARGAARARAHRTHSDKLSSPLRMR